MDIDMRKKGRKIAFVAIVILLLGVTGLVLVIGPAADRAIGSAIERAGTETLGVDVKIDHVDLSLFRGGLTLQGIVINNPPGYQHGKLLTLESGVMQIRIMTLMADRISVKTLTLQGIDLVVEQKGFRSNLQDVMDMIENSTASKLARRELEIDTLEISDIRVRVKLLPLPGKMDTVTLKLAPIKMYDLGKDKPLNVGTLLAELVRALFESATEQGFEVASDDLAAGLFKALGRTVNIGRRIFDGAPGAQNILESAGNLGFGFGKGLQEVLGESNQAEPNVSESN